MRLHTFLFVLSSQCVLTGFASKNKNINDLGDFNPEDMKDLEILLEPIEMMESARSPLDEHKSPKSKGQISKMRQAYRGRMINNMQMLSICQQNCSKGLEETFNSMIESMSHVERYRRICKNYNESSACINMDKKCGDEDNTMFEVITSGLRYMCVDQVFAFNATIDCIDKQSSLVQNECESLCNTKNVIMNWIMRSSVAQSIQNGISAGLTEGGALAGTDLSGVLSNLQIPPESEASFMSNMKSLGKDMCSTSTCILDCVRSKFNARCEGSAGTLLSEVLVRPIATTQEKMAIISPIMGLFFPEECNFLHSGYDLSKHRIDPTLHEELRRMYITKEVERNMKDKNGTNTTVPSFKLPNYQKSPFDGETDIGALIDQLYGPRDHTIVSEVLQKSMRDEDSQEDSLEKKEPQEDSLKKKNLQQDSLKQKSLQQDSLEKTDLQQDSRKQKTLKQHSLEKKNLHQDSLKHKSLHPHSLKKKDLQQDFLEKNDLQQDSRKQKTLKQDSLEKDDSQQDSLEKDDLQQDSLENKGSLEKKDLHQESKEQKKLQQESMEQDDFPENFLKSNNEDHALTDDESEELAEDSGEMATDVKITLQGSGEEGSGIIENSEGSGVEEDWILEANAQTIFHAHAIAGEAVSFVHTPSENGNMICQLMN